MESIESSLNSNPLKGAIMMVSKYLKQEEMISRLIERFAPKSVVFISARNDLNTFLSHCVQLNDRLHYSIITPDSLSSVDSSFVLGINYLDFVKSNSLLICWSFIYRFFKELTEALGSSFDGLLFIDDLPQIYPQICAYDGLYARLISCICDLQRNLASANVIYIESSFFLSEEDRLIMLRTTFPKLVEELFEKYPQNMSYLLCRFICNWQTITHMSIPCFQSRLNSNVQVSHYSMANPYYLIPLYSLFPFF